MCVRKATLADVTRLSELRARLWPSRPLDEHVREAESIVAGRPVTTMPLAVFVAEAENGLIGFVEVDLRSHADGCDPARPCGYLEGWYVDPEHRRRGVGRELVAAAEAWCRAHGCIELASDTWIDREVSQRAHAALGFEVVDRCVHFRKSLPPLEPSAGPRERQYGPTLARIHHEQFGMVARAAARDLSARLAKRGVVSGTVVDLGAGSGILSRQMTELGFEVWGVDVSPDMLAIARVEAPRATFVQGSLWDVSLPSCVAVAAVGEAFSYAADPKAGFAALEGRLAVIHEALAPGGLLLFDVAGPGRSGASARRSAFWSEGGDELGFEESESPDGELTRHIVTFSGQGNVCRREQETHVLRLYAPDALEDALRRLGFEWERLEAYDDFRFHDGWHAFAATKR